MALWNIQESETVKEQLEYYRADKAVTRNYLQFIKELARSGNPASMGNPKKRQAPRLFWQEDYKVCPPCLPYLLHSPQD